MKKVWIGYFDEIEIEFLRTMAYENKTSQSKVARRLINHLMDTPELMTELKEIKLS